MFLYLVRRKELLTFCTLIKTNVSIPSKSATWANNDKIPPHSRAKLLNCIWKLKITPEVKIFAWELVRSKSPTREYLRNIVVDLNGNCSFYHNYTDHLFMNCHFMREVWNTITDYCHIPINSKLHFIGWIDHISVHGKAYNKIFPNSLKKDSSDCLVYLGS